MLTLPYGFLSACCFRLHAVENFLGTSSSVFIFMRMMSGLLSDGSANHKIKSMIRTLRFPRASLVFSQTSSSNDNAAKCGIDTAFLAQWKFPHWTVLLVSRFYAHAHIRCGLMFIAARLTASPDIKAVMHWRLSVVLLSGVMFPLDRKPHANPEAYVANRHIFPTAVRDT